LNKNVKGISLTVKNNKDVNNLRVTPDAKFYDIVNLLHIDPKQFELKRQPMNLDNEKIKLCKTRTANRLLPCEPAVFNGKFLLWELCKISATTTIERTEKIDIIVFLCLCVLIIIYS
jgi:hypothetical protein